MLVLAAAVVLLDQFSKAAVIQNFKPGVLAPMLGDLVQFNLVFNDSAAFSIGFGATYIFAILSSVAALVMLWYSAKVASNSWAILLGIALGGVTGNLIDRLIRDSGLGNGRVVDFIQIPFNFPVFNLADSAIVIVAVVTVIRMIRGDQVGKARHND